MRYLFVIFSLLVVTGCADNVSFEQASQITEVGFWYGLWHGLIMLFAFIGSLFSDSVTVYAIYNNGGWYNFGFLLGAASMIGLGRSAK